MTAKELEEWPVTEPPTEAQVGRVRRAAAEAEGMALQNFHEPRSTIYHMPGEHYWQPRTERSEELVGCGRMAEFTLPLERQNWQEAGARREGYGGLGTPQQRSANQVRLCAVDDAAYLWPRFQ